jgi:predicted esterase
MLWVDTRFSTSKEAIWRAVAGASNGGNIALYCTMKSPHIFGSVAAQSSNVISSIMSGFDVNPPLPNRVYIDIGAYDIPQLIPLAETISDKSLKKDHIGICTNKLMKDIAGAIGKPI